MPESVKPIIVGKITGASGIRGWVKVHSYSEPRKNILEYKSWLLATDNGWRSVEVSTGREQGKTLVAQLKDCTDRNQAEALRGTEIAIRPEQLPTLSADEFYWRDLIGLEVVNQEEQLLGKVSHLFETGANDVLVVKKPGGGECLIPWVMDVFILAVDLPQSRIRVDWQEDF